MPGLTLDDGLYGPAIEDLLDIAQRLAAVAPRGACGDGERRAAVLARDELRARGRPARLEPAWVRPGRPALHAATCALAVAGSLVAVAAPAAGLGLLLGALVLFAGDVSGALPAGRLLLPRRATQNVVSEPPRAGPHARVRLIVTAGLDAGRSGLAHRLASPARRLPVALRSRLPPVPAVLAAAMALLAALAGARLAGAQGAWLGWVALAPTVALLLAAAALADIAVAPPTAGAPAAAAVALALVAELDRAPPRHLAVELVLAGAAEPGELGLRAYVAARRRAARPEELAVLALGPCGAGPPRFHLGEGSLPRMRLHPGLIAAARAAAGDDPGLGAAPLRRGRSGALVARRAGWPSLGVSCPDARGRPGAAHGAADTVEAPDPAALRAALELCRGLVTQLDRELGHAERSRSVGAAR